MIKKNDLVITKKNKSEKIIPGKGGKKLRNIKMNLDKEKFHALSDAVQFLKENSFTKFVSTLEVILNLGVDPKYSDQMVRGVVAMPHGTGKSIKVAVIARDKNAEIARESGADVVGAEELIDSISAGNINFDICIATPDMMGIVGKVAKILGPKGLMPNPKLGTVTLNIDHAVKQAKSGQVEFKVEKAGIIHAGVGKLSFETVDLCENIKSLIAAVLKSKPSGAKGTYLKSAYLTSTMGPSLKLDLLTVTNN